MRDASTYRSARRNARPAGSRWINIAAGAYPRKPHNAAKLKPAPVVVLPVISPLLAMLMRLAGIGPLDAQVADALNNAVENDHGFAGWTDEEIAYDLIAYCAGMEHLSVADLLPHVRAWRNKGAVEQVAA